MDKTRSMAWETTADDVLNVLDGMTNRLRSTLMEADAVLKKLDHGKIEDAALHGNEMDEQVSYAYKEIKKQIIEGKLI
jgi:hypothetical protein